jgi:methylated-DNA-[protein]-cysteine S-methyltransferase
MTLYAHQFATPFGEMLAVVDEQGYLSRLDFVDESQAQAITAKLEKQGETIEQSADACATVVSQLEEYFAGARQRFDLPLLPRGTAFQQTVWGALQQIPYGSTLTYRELAHRIGNPAAVRAVGRANATNPIAIVVPCHRVIGADGTLTGYAGGLARKANLLALEGAILTLPL